MSHPTWVRGLKQIHHTAMQRQNYVAPYVGAWIETWMAVFITSFRFVAPYVGAWIETGRQPLAFRYERSHPTWVRGLKLQQIYRTLLLWSRTLRGCVD